MSDHYWRYEASLWLFFHRLFKENLMMFDVFWLFIHKIEDKPQEYEISANLITLLGHMPLWVNNMSHQATKIGLKIILFQGVLFSHFWNWTVNLGFFLMDFLRWIWWWWKLTDCLSTRWVVKPQGLHRSFYYGTWGTLLSHYWSWMISLGLFLIIILRWIRWWLKLSDCWSTRWVDKPQGLHRSFYSRMLSLVIFWSWKVNLRVLMIIFSKQIRL